MNEFTYPFVSSSAAEFLGAADALAIPFVAGLPVEVIEAIWRGETDRARTILLQDLRDYPLDAGAWHGLLKNPWLENLRLVPEVAARFEETIAVKEQVTDDLRGMRPTCHPSRRAASPSISVLRQATLR